MDSPGRALPPRRVRKSALLASAVETVASKYATRMPSSNHRRSLVFMLIFSQVRWRSAFLLQVRQSWSAMHRCRCPSGW